MKNLKPPDRTGLIIIRDVDFEEWQDLKWKDGPLYRVFDIFYIPGAISDHILNDIYAIFALILFDICYILKALFDICYTGNLEFC